MGAKSVACPPILRYRKREVTLRNEGLPSTPAADLPVRASIPCRELSLSAAATRASPALIRRFARFRWARYARLAPAEKDTGSPPELRRRTPCAAAHDQHRMRAPPYPQRDRVPLHGRPNRELVPVERKRQSAMLRCGIWPGAIRDLDTIRAHHGARSACAALRSCVGRCVRPSESNSRAVRVLAALGWSPMSGDAAALAHSSSPVERTGSDNHGRAEVDDLLFAGFEHAGAATREVGGADARSKALARRGRDSRAYGSRHQVGAASVFGCRTGDATSRDPTALPGHTGAFQRQAGRPALLCASCSFSTAPRRTRFSMELGANGAPATSTVNSRSSYAVFPSLPNCARR